MSGHSKWHKIQHKKGKTDAARSAQFTKAAHAITIAAREGGGDPEMNFALRLAIEKAKGLNVPRDNIDRALKRGTGELTDGTQIETILYEGYGPEGVGVLIATITDNKNRTVSEVKLVLSKQGGTLGTPGSVQWQFERKGVIRVSAEKKSHIADWDNFELSLMDMPIEDIRVSEEGVEIFTAPEHLKTVLDFLSKTNIEPDDSGLEWIAKEPMHANDALQEKIEKLTEALEDLPDVSDVYTTIA